MGERVKTRKELIDGIREKLHDARPSVGSWMQIPSASLAEIMGAAGYDWVAVDLEHGSISTHQLPDLFRALALGGTLPLARIACDDPKDCKQALDAGAGGIIVPMVSSATQLKRVLDACRWPPTGTRGVGFSRANLFGKQFLEYQEEAQAPLVVAMIEHVDAVENLQEILAVEGLDAILIGPYDLSASMNMVAQFEAPEFKSIIQYIYDCATASNIACGIHVVEPDPKQLNHYIREGYRFLAYSIDAVFLSKNSNNPVDNYLFNQQDKIAQESIE
jgi:2-dehydro-3-deoxyglucarate aldolase